jgi:hypothetical protein
MNGDQVIPAPKQVQLAGEKLHALELGRIDHDEVVIVVGVATRPLVRLGHFGEGELVESEGLAQQGHLFWARVGDVEPDPAIGIGQELGESFRSDLGRRALSGSVHHESDGAHHSSFERSSCRPPEPNGRAGVAVQPVRLRRSFGPAHPSRGFSPTVAAPQ